MSSKMLIEVSFLAGTDLTKAIKEARDKAYNWDVVYVKFDFNGKRFSIGRNAIVAEAIAQYNNPEISLIVSA